MSDTQEASVDAAWSGPFDHEALRATAPSQFRVLFEPLAIGPKVAPNRFFTVPYATGWGMHQINLEIGHRAVRAEGGWGVVTTGETPIAPEATTAIIEGLELFDDADAAEVARIADAIHTHGALAGIELSHYGGLADPAVWRVPAHAVTQMQSDAMFFSSSIGMNMTLEDVARISDEYVAAARRARAAGFDIVYLHCAHSGLPMQFLARYYNQRTDDYGGSLENRARFLIETLAAMKAAIGHDTAVACRFAIEAQGPGGLEIDEALEVMRMADEHVDLWDLTVGALSNSNLDLTPSRLFPEGASLEWTARAKEATSKPVVGSGRFTDVDLMARLITGGQLDFIGSARPGIADPFMPRKIAAGETSRIRECIGSNRCAYSQITGTMACSQNATLGEEYRRGWHPERFSPASNRDRPVLIVGGGPAGLECATVLHRRGFENIHVVDRADRAGGHMRWFSRLPGFNPWARVVDHRVSLIEASGAAVTFVPGTELDADAIFGYGASIVIVATGSRWNTTGVNVFDNSAIPGADATDPRVLTPEQAILDGKPLPDGRVLVYDCQGDFSCVAVAQWVQAQGRDVELASPFADIAYRSHQDGISFALRGEFQGAGGRLRPGLILVEVTPTGGVFLDEMMQPVEIEFDALVMMTSRVSDDTIYHELAARHAEWEAAGVETVYRIGDCASPQNLSEAIFSGHRLAREIDQPTPARPLIPLRH